MRRRLDRRTFLRASGIALGLPLLANMEVDTVLGKEESGDASDVRRMLAIGAPLGIHTPYFFPDKAGRDYEIPRYLEPMQTLRQKFTVVSGTMHPDVTSAHDALQSFLTGAPHPGQPSFRNTISFDQLAAEKIGHKTRYASLVLGENATSMSWTRGGACIPAETLPSKLFTKLFLDGSEAEKKEQLRRIEDGQSIMDMVQDQTRKMSQHVGREDNRTLEQYFSSVRELEQRLGKAESWVKRPKPPVGREKPEDIHDRSELTERLRLMYDMIFLAIQTDSTRLITFLGPGGNHLVNLNGVDDEWHNLSHHGKDPSKIEKLAIIELEEMRLLAELLQRLEDTREGENTLLDQTAVLFGSSLGNASSHNNTNLPILAAGGHFRHGQHLAFKEETAPPLCNLIVSFLQHLGLEIDQFSSGTGTLTGLDAW